MIFCLLGSSLCHYFERRKDPGDEVGMIKGYLEAPLMITGLPWMATWEATWIITGLHGWLHGKLQGSLVASWLTGIPISLPVLRLTSGPKQSLSRVQ